MGAIVLNRGEIVFVTCVRQNRFRDWHFDADLVVWWDTTRTENAREVPPNTRVEIIGKHGRSDKLVRNLNELSAGKNVQKMYPKNDDSAREEIEKIVRATTEARSREAEEANPQPARQSPPGPTDSPLEAGQTTMQRGMTESPARVFVREHLADVEGLHGQEAGNVLVRLAKEEGIAGERNSFLSILGAVRHEISFPAVSPLTPDTPAAGLHPQELPQGQHEESPAHQADEAVTAEEQPHEQGLPGGLTEPPPQPEDRQPITGFDILSKPGDGPPQFLDTARQPPELSGDERLFVRPGPLARPPASPASSPPPLIAEPQVSFKRGMLLREFVQANLHLVEGLADYAAGKRLAELGQPHGYSSNASSYYNYLRELRGTAPQKPAPAPAKLKLVPGNASQPGISAEELRLRLEGIFTDAVAAVLKALEPVLVENAKATARCSTLEAENARLTQQVQELPDKIRQAIADLLQPQTPSAAKTGQR